MITTAIAGALVFPYTFDGPERAATCPPINRPC